MPIVCFSLPIDLYSAVWLKCLFTVRHQASSLVQYPKSSPDRQPIPTLNPGQSSINGHLLQLLDNWLKTICTNCNCRITFPSSQDLKKKKHVKYSDILYGHPLILDVKFLTKPQQFFVPAGVDATATLFVEHQAFSKLF